jgi:DNA-binding SARP family transcriptional activator
MFETTSSTVRLELLGGALLHAPERKTWKLERKTAALLAFLTLEGGTTRSRLAGLLWPDSLESTARNNLSQVARRLREGAGIALLTGDDRLSLSPELSIDASNLELEAFAGNDETVLGFAGELLEELDYDDCPEFQDWLLIKREGFLALRRDAHVRLSQAAEQAGQSRLALEHANQVLELDPVSEVAHRHVMRLHYQNGDRGAALNAFERCKQTLEQELGVPPLPETLALAEAISQGATVQQTTPARLEIPLTVLRPPVLIGRELEWQQLETAWNQGLQIVICGEPGIGKSRLLFDFATSHGQHLLLEGRPGDTNVSFSSYARSLRRAISQYSTLEFEDWVRSELSRLLPELTNTAPAPLQNQEEKLRFFEAIACALETICQQQVLSSIVVDDLQFMDAASLEAHEYIVTRLAPTGLRFLNAHRTNELPESLEERIQTEIGTGTTARLEIKALEVEQVSRWITSLEINAPDLSTRLVKHTGGNPMFMLETIKSLLETNQLAQNTALPTPTRVGTLIRQRLERLSSSALRLARVAAITGTDYSLGLAAKILETNALDLSEIAGELEQAQLMTSGRFAHDLIFEAVQAGTPKSIATFVHTQTATHLETSDAEPARIAHHWLGGGQGMKAVPYLVRVAERWEETGLVYQAASQYKLAAQIAEHHDKVLAFDLYHQLLTCQMEYNVDSEFQASLEKLFQMAQTSEQFVEALEFKIEFQLLRGQFQEAISICDEALSHVTSGTEPHGRILNQKHISLANSGKIQEALECLLVADQIFTQTENIPRLNTSKRNLALLYMRLGQYQNAIQYHEESLKLDDFPLQKIRQHNNHAMTFVELGEIFKAKKEITAVWNGFSKNHSETRLKLAILLNLATISFHLSEFSEALAFLDLISPDKEDSSFWNSGNIHRCKGMVLFELGDPQAAQFHLHEALQFGLPMGAKGMTWLALTLCASQLGEDFQDLFQKAKSLMLASGERRMYFQFQLTDLLLRPHKNRFKTAQKILQEAEAEKIPGTQIAAHTRYAQILLTLDRPEHALQHTEEAQGLLASFDSNHVRRNEVLLTHQRALEANHHPDAPAHLERTLSWLLEVADNNVPSEYRQSFLERNPHNAAILELARNAGLKIP